MADTTGNKRILIVLFIIFTVLQVVGLFYWKNQKCGFFIDEYYTLGYTCTFTADEHGMLDKLSVYEEGEWTNADTLKDYYTFSPEKSVFRSSLFSNLKHLTRRNSYAFLLNIVCTVFPDSSMTDLSIYLNIALFVVVQLVLFFFVRKLSDSYFAALLCTVMFGFTGITIGLVEYVRFYMWGSLLFILLLLLHFLIWKEENRYIQLLLELLMGVVLLLSYRVFQVVTVFAFIYSIVFFVALIVRKERTKAVLYIVPIMAGGLIFAYASGILYNIFNPNEASNDHYRDAADSLTGFNWTRIVNNLNYWYKVLWEQICGARATILFFVIMIAAFCILSFAKRIKNSEKDVFVLLLVPTSVLSFLFIVVSNLTKTRYNYYVYIMMIIVISYMCDRVLRSCNFTRDWCRYGFVALCVLAVLYGSYKTQSNRWIENLFEDDKEAIDLIRSKYGDWDNVCLHETQKNGNGHVMECIYNSGADTGFLLLTEDTYPNFEDYQKDRFLLWLHRGGEVLNGHDLEEEGYKMFLMASTHISDVYVCEKK